MLGPENFLKILLSFLFLLLSKLIKSLLFKKCKLCFLSLSFGLSFLFCCFDQFNSPFSFFFRFLWFLKQLFSLGFLKSCLLPESLSLCSQKSLLSLVRLNLSFLGCKLCLNRKLLSFCQLINITDTKVNLEVAKHIRFQLSRYFEKGRSIVICFELQFSIGVLSHVGYGEIGYIDRWYRTVIMDSPILIGTAISAPHIFILSCSWIMKLTIVIHHGFKLPSFTRVIQNFDFLIGCRAMKSLLLHIGEAGIDISHGCIENRPLKAIPGEWLLMHRLWPSLVSRLDRERIYSRNHIPFTIFQDTIVLFYRIQI